MPLPNALVFPLLAGVAIAVIIATVYKCTTTSYTTNGYKSDTPSSCDTWSDIFSTNDKVRQRKKKPGKHCTVCLDEFDEIAKQNRTIYSIRCGHMFCYDCVRLLKSCPLCRASINHRGDLHKIVW